MFLGLPDRIARVFINLIENAVSFAGENGQVCVTLKKSWRHGIIVTVEDSGPGVPELLEQTYLRGFLAQDKVQQCAKTALVLACIYANKWWKRMRGY